METGLAWLRATSVGGGRLSKTIALTLDLPGAYHSSQIP